MLRQLLFIVFITIGIGIVCFISKIDEFTTDNTTLHIITIFETQYAIIGIIGFAEKVVAMLTGLSCLQLTAVGLYHTWSPDAILLISMVTMIVTMPLYNGT
jgi:hypothetical protein